MDGMRLVQQATDAHRAASRSAMGPGLSPADVSRIWGGLTVPRASVKKASEVFGFDFLASSRGHGMPGQANAKIVSEPHYDDGIVLRTGMYDYEFLETPVSGTHTRPVSGRHIRSENVQAPDTSVWASTCSPSTAIEDCPEARDVRRRMGCRNTASRDWLNVSACSSTWEDLIRSAWCLLNDNLDLLEWVWCFTDASSTPFSEMQGYLTRVLFQVDVICVDSMIEDRVEKCVAGTEGVAVLADAERDWAGGRVRICMKHLMNQEYEEIWGCGDEAARTCVLVEVAALLAHEIMHLAIPGGEDHPGGCDPLFMFENTLRWTLLKRYSNAMNAPCCQEGYGMRQNRLVPDPEKSFMNVAGINMATNCACEVHTGSSSDVNCLKHPEDCEPPERREVERRSE